MENIPLIIHRINHHDIIYFVNREWIAFADQNQTPNLNNMVLGRSMWDFIQSDVVCNIYKKMVKKVRDTEDSISFIYRCDAPDTVREIKMSILPLPNSHVEFQNHVTREQKREPLALLDTQAARNHNIVKMCSFCNSIETVIGWLEVENAMEIITSERNDDSISCISHGICDDCFKSVKEDILKE